METGLDICHSFTLADNPFTFGAHAAVIEVSRETGNINIIKYVGVHDCGHIFNPAFVAGQIRGGIAQGFGQALTVGITYSSEGQPLTGSLMDYAVPRASTMPELSLTTLSTLSSTNSLGARGIGSVSTVRTPAAITNAVMDALSQVGVRHLDMPLTPAKIWHTLQAVAPVQMVSS